VKKESRWPQWGRCACWSLFTAFLWALFSSWGSGRSLNSFLYRWQRSGVRLLIVVLRWFMGRGVPWLQRGLLFEDRICRLCWALIMAGSSIMEHQLRFRAAHIPGTTYRLPMGFGSCSSLIHRALLRTILHFREWYSWGFLAACTLEWPWKTGKCFGTRMKSRSRWVWLQLAWNCHFHRT
jgi:hypothetical protein